MRGINLLSAMTCRWRSVIPVGLVDQNLVVLIKLFELGQRTEGISKKELASELGLQQSHLCKLTAKLEALGLVTVTTPTADHRFRLVRITAAAQSLLYNLEAEILPLLPADGVDPFIAAYNSELPNIL